MIILKCFLIGISWIEGNAEELPIDTASVDAYTIAFGIRNVTRIHKVTINSVLLFFFYFFWIISELICFLFSIYSENL